MYTLTKMLNIFAFGFLNSAFVGSTDFPWSVLPFI